MGYPYFGKLQYSDFAGLQEFSFCAGQLIRGPSFCLAAAAFILVSYFIRYHLACGYRQTLSCAIATGCVDVVCLSRTVDCWQMMVCLGRALRALENQGIFDQDVAVLGQTLQPRSQLSHLRG